MLRKKQMTSNEMEVKTQNEKLPPQKEENFEKEIPGTVQEKISISQVTEAVTQLHEEKKISPQSEVSEPVHYSFSSSFFIH
jgi:hypothetical protein